MTGRQTLYETLKADSGIIAVVGTKVSNGPNEPEAWGPDDSTLSIYQYPYPKSYFFLAMKQH